MTVVQYRQVHPKKTFQCRIRHNPEKEIHSTMHKHRVETTKNKPWGQAECRSRTADPSRSSVPIWGVHRQRSARLCHLYHSG